MAKQGGARARIFPKDPIVDHNGTVASGSNYLATLAWLQVNPALLPR
jgi:hypothetical protein